MPVSTVRWVTPWSPDVPRNGPTQIAVSCIEGGMRCDDCQRLHPYNVGRTAPEGGDPTMMLFNDWEGAYSQALAWLPEVDEYWCRRVADADEDNEAYRVTNKHEAVDWLLQL
jgi:hypothetical protein